MTFADEDKKMNATYIISVARKLGCSIFLLPEDIMEVVFYSKIKIFTLVIALACMKKYHIYAGMGGIFLSYESSNSSVWTRGVMQCPNFDP